MAGQPASTAGDVKPVRFSAVHLERLIEISPDIVIAVDRHGTIIYYNDGAEKNLGYSGPEILHHKVTEIYPSIEEAQRVMAAMRSEEYGGPGKVKDFETVFVNRWKEKIPVTISGSVVCDDDGLEIGSIGFAKDIRDLRKRDRLATLGEVAVAICHEINSPLEVIVNEVELLHQYLRRTGKDEDVVVEEERLEAVRREVGKILEVVNRLVDMARKGEYESRTYLGKQTMTDMGGAPSPEAPVTRQSMQGLRVLVVDDDLGVCRSLRDVLVAEGCEVQIATDGLKALEIFDRTPADIVLTDVVMGDLDGYDLFMEIKRRGDTPVVLMTGFYYDRDHVIKRSRIEGLDAVIFKKPVDPARLKDVIRRQCGIAAEEEPRVTGQSTPQEAAGKAAE